MTMTMMMMFSSIGEYIANDDDGCDYDHGDVGDYPVNLDHRGHDYDEDDYIQSDVQLMIMTLSFSQIQQFIWLFIVWMLMMTKIVLQVFLLVAASSGFPKMNQWRKI